jgi:2-oxoglutarate ferredoxin oxidoreductase subunit beta
MHHVPMGIFRQVTRTTYDDAVRDQVQTAVAAAGDQDGTAALDALLRGRDTWTVDGTRPGEVEQTLEGETTEGPTAAAGDALTAEGDQAFSE